MALNIWLLGYMISSIKLYLIALRNRGLSEGKPLIIWFIEKLLQKHYNSHVMTSHWEWLFKDKINQTTNKHGNLVITLLIIIRSRIEYKLYIIKKTIFSI